MIPRRWHSPVDELRAFIAGAVAQGAAQVDGARALLALDALLTARDAPPQGMALTVCRWVRAATQLAAAVDAGAVAEPNRRQARNLLAKWEAVVAAVEAWTDGGRCEPAAPSPVHDDLPQAAGAEAGRGR
jgi:hypothetical protein